MKTLLHAGALALALFASASTMAQTVPSSCPRADGAFIACIPVVPVDPSTGRPVPANSDPSTGAKQTANTAAITAVQSAPGSIASTSSTVTVVLPQVSASDYGSVFGVASVPLFPQNLNRRGIVLQNQSATAACYIRAGTAATADYHSMMLAPGAYFESSSHVSTAAVNIICTASNTPVYARDF